MTMCRSMVIYFPNREISCLQMKVLGIIRIQNFYSQHANAKGPLLAWLHEAKDATWSSPQTIKEKFPHVSFPAKHNGSVAIFNIGGNNFRLEVIVRYEGSIVLIQDINTHANYDKKNKKRNN